MLNRAGYMCGSRKPSTPTDDARAQRHAHDGYKDDVNMAAEIGGHKVYKHSSMEEKRSFASDETERMSAGESECRHRVWCSLYTMV